MVPDGSRRLNRSTLAALAVVAMLVLAGCGGTGGTPTADLDVTETEVIENARAAMDGVSAYSIAGELNITQGTNNVTQSFEADIEGDVDLANEEAYFRQTLSIGPQSVPVEVYLADGTLYQRSQLLVQQFNSEWIRIDVSENLTRQFRSQDELGAHLTMLGNGTVTLEGREEVNGTEAYRLAVDANETALGEFYQLTGDQSASIRNASATVWVDAETSRIVRVDGHIERRTTLQGQSATTAVDYSERFSYGSVDISLPSAASSAVEINGSGLLAGA